MGRHARDCLIYQTQCLCNTCVHDSIFKSPACCSKHKQEGAKHCPIEKCESYKKEGDDIS